MNETTPSPSPLPKLTVQEHKAQQWNKEYPHGALVRRYKALYPRREPFEIPCFTVGPAYVVDGHTTVIRVEGFEGCVNLEALEVLEKVEAPKKEPVKETAKLNAPKVNPPTLPKIPA